MVLIGSGVKDMGGGQLVLFVFVVVFRFGFGFGCIIIVIIGWVIRGCSIVGWFIYGVFGGVC